MSVQLDINGLSKHFGGVTALDSVNLRIQAGELVGLIGPNGSGKTTMLNIISGYYQADSGFVCYEGRDILGLPPYKLAQRGIGRSFQVTKVFRRLTVVQNVLVSDLTDWRVRWGDADKRARTVLKKLKLDHLADEPAANLSGGQVKLLEFARIMMLRPRLVLLDEPFGGVHPELKRFMYECIRAWNEEGASVILISHDMGSIFGLCRRVVTLSRGEVICDGTAEETRSHPAVLEAYLGGHHHAA